MASRRTCMRKSVTRPHTPLALYLGLGYALLIVYASLYPLTGWRDSGAAPLDFIFAGWPRYTTTFDLVTNLLAYMPLGFFLAAALRRWFGALSAVALAALLAAFLSLLMEFTQNYLPSRIASNLDLGGNALGALAGALAGAWYGWQLLDNLRHAHWPAARQGIEAGLLLLSLWLLLQFDPAILPFGTGDLRDLLDMFGSFESVSSQDFSASGFQQMEAMITAGGVLTALLVGGLVAPSHQRRLFPASLLSLGLAAKAWAFALMMRPQAALDWATPGSMAGLAIGVALWLGASFLPASGQRALAALALLLTTALVNLAPTNPYLENALQSWNPGQFLNFHGLTHFVATLWPYLVLPWLMLDHRRHVETQGNG